jgi:hypothetical protein
VLIFYSFPHFIFGSIHCQTNLEQCLIFRFLQKHYGTNISTQLRCILRHILVQRTTDFLSQLFCLCRYCHKFYSTLEKDYFCNPSKSRRFSFITNDIVMLSEDIQKALSLQFLWYNINSFLNKLSV